MVSNGYALESARAAVPPEAYFSYIYIYFSYIYDAPNTINYNLTSNMDIFHLSRLDARSVASPSTPLLVDIVNVALIPPAPSRDNIPHMSVMSVLPFGKPRLLKTLSSKR